jgi:hypothetical protein
MVTVAVIVVLFTTTMLLAVGAGPEPLSNPTAMPEVNPDPVIVTSKTPPRQPLFG